MMPVTIRETGKRSATLSRNPQTPSTAKREYTIYGAADELDAAEQLEAWLISAGLYVRGALYAQPITAEDTGARTADGLRAYKAHVNWSTATAEDDEEDPEIWEEDWDLGVEQSKLVVPRGTINVYAKTSGGGTPPTIKLLGDKADGKAPEGIDWPSPVDIFSITRTYDKSVIDSAFRATIDGLRGRLNNATFRTYPAECCRFLGASMRGSKGEGRASVTYRFEGRQPKTIALAGFTTLTDIPGFDVVWTLDEGRDDNGSVAAEPQFLCRGKVGYLGDFSALGLG